MLAGPVGPVAGRCARTRTALWPPVTLLGVSSRIVLVAQMVARACFLVLLVLGALLWTGRADSLRGLHVATGVLLVLALWTIAGAALVRGVSRGPAAGAAVWGIVTVVFGLTQESVLPGGSHWAAQVAHLLVGVIAIGLAEMIALRFRRAL